MYLNHGSVNLDFVEMDLRQALDTLAGQMGAQFDMPPEVQGVVTTHLRNLTYAQALEQLLGHTFVYTIGPHDVIYIHKRGTTWRPGREEDRKSTRLNSSH